MEPTLSSGSVVFSLPHLRDAVFAYHAQHLLQERSKRLDAFDRKVPPSFFTSAPQSYQNSRPDSFFAARLRAFESESNICEVLRALGLQVATYLDLLSSRMDDVSLWIAATSTLGGSRKWLTPNRRSHRLEALPKPHARTGTPSEHPQSSAIEMLYHGAGGDPRGVYATSWGSASSWGGSEGLGQILKDRVGRLYFARVLDTRLQRFPLEAAARRPELLYSADTPFLPHHDVISYSEDSNIGIVITECPPYPLSHLLASAQWRERAELRRVLERMHDLFSHLVVLEEHGISLNGKAPSEGWVGSFRTSGAGLWFVPAYLEPAAKSFHPGRLARSALFEERLPEPPSNAWPVAPLEGERGIAGLPWSQLTAYSDPRVKGPTTYLHGVLDASWHDSDQSWKERRYHYGHVITSEVEPTSRFHCDLINFTDSLLQQFFPVYDVRFTKVVQLLEAGTPAKFYEESISNGADSGPCDPASGHSGLFSFCVNCIFKDRRGRTSRLDQGPDKCKACSRHCMANAMPKAIQDLLLRILKTPLNADGSRIIVTAQEALATIKTVMDTELPRMIRVYELWVQKQKPVQRMTTVAPLPLDKIRADASADRWTLFELLRGNHLDAKFTRQDRKETRDLVKAHLDGKKKQEAWTKVEGAKRQATAVAAASHKGNEGKLAMTVAQEAELLKALLTATYGDSKRGAEGEENEGDTAAKRLKMT